MEQWQWNRIVLHQNLLEIAPLSIKAGVNVKYEYVLDDSP